MKFRDFQLPQKLEWIEEKKNYGKFTCEPFERGYGHTIGNSLRRILLASLEGAVITSIKINNVPHEYAVIEGIKEDVLEIILNLKQLRFKLFTEESQTIKLEASGSKNIKGGDFKLNESVELMNPEKSIATLDENAKLEIEATVERGRGYMPASERYGDLEKPGIIPLDADFAPVKKVNYEVENARVGQATDYDRLLMEIWTDGSVNVSEAITYSAKILKKTIEIFEEEKVEEIQFKEKEEDEEEPKESEDDKVKELPLEDLKISTRIENSLKRDGITKIGDLVERNVESILKIDKVGEKSLSEIKDKIEEMNKERGVNFELKKK